MQTRSSTLPHPNPPPQGGGNKYNSLPHRGSRARGDQSRGQMAEGTNTTPSPPGGEKSASPNGCKYNADKEF
jgi:hypothetical protein